VDDTAIKVATEMVQALYLPESCIEAVAKHIQTQVDPLLEKRHLEQQNILVNNAIDTAPKSPRSPRFYLNNANNVTQSPGDFIRFSDDHKPSRLSPRDIHPPKPSAHIFKLESDASVDLELNEFIEKQRLDRLAFEKQQLAELEDFKAKLKQKRLDIIKQYTSNKPPAVNIDPFSLGEYMTPRITPLEPKKSST